MNILAVKCCGKYFDSAALASELTEHLRRKYGVVVSPVVAELLSITAVLGDPNEAIDVLWTEDDLLREVEQKEVCEELRKLKLADIRCVFDGKKLNLQISTSLINDMHKFLCDLVRDLIQDWKDARDVMILASYLLDKRHEAVELTCTTSSAQRMRPFKA